MNNKTFRIFCAIMPTAMSLALSLFGCSEKKVDKEALLKLRGAEVQYPRTLKPVNMAVSAEEYTSGADYTIVSYADSSGCTSCKMRLGHWINRMEKYNFLTDKDVRLVMIAQSSDSAMLVADLRRSGFNYPVYLDESNAFRISNCLPDDHQMQTLLLDSEGVVVAIGNPAYNDKINSLFLRIISYEDDDLANDSKTANPGIVISPSFINLGILTLMESKEFIVNVENTTDSQLSVTSISTSCPCTMANLGVDTLAPHQRKAMTVSVSNDSVAGWFEREVEIWSSESQSPAILKIRGYGK